MWKLICYEWKKIVKSRSGVILLTLLVLTCGYQIKSNMDSTLKDYSYVSDEKMDVLKEQQKYDGKSFVEMKETLKETFDEEADRQHYNEKRPLDKDYMKMMYGMHWKEVMQAYEKGTLTQEMLKKWQVRNTDDEKSDKIAVLEDFHMEYVYLDANENADRKNLYPDITMLTNRQAYLYTKEKAKAGSTQCFLGDCAVFDAKYYDTLNTRFLNASKTYHTTIVANKYSSDVGRANFLIILLISILLGNMYSKESSEQTQVYLSTSKAGLKKAPLAKLIVALMIGVLLPMLIPIVSCIANYIQYGGISLDMFYFNYGDFSAYDAIPYIFTYRELLLLGFVSMLVGYSALTFTSLTLSRYVKNSYIAGIIVLLIAILPIYNVFHFGDLDFNIWFPSYMLMRFFDNIGLTPQVFVAFGDAVFPRVWLYVLLWCIGSGICAFLLHYKNRKHFI